jgi:hypothetical protein
LTLFTRHSPDLWAPDSATPNRWAPDSRGHLTLGRAVDLFLGAKAAEGASPKTITWYRMILMRAIAAFGADQSVDRLTGPDLRFWLVELRTGHYARFVGVRRLVCVSDEFLLPWRSISAEQPGGLDTKATGLERTHGHRCRTHHR